MSRLTIKWELLHSGQEAAQRSTCAPGTGWQAKQFNAQCTHTAGPLSKCLNATGAVHTAQLTRPASAWAGHMREHLERLNVMHNGARPAQNRHAWRDGPSRLVGHTQQKAGSTEQTVRLGLAGAKQPAIAVSPHICSIYHHQDEWALAGSSQQAPRAGHWAQKHRPAAREALVVHKDKVSAVDAWLQAQLQEGGSSGSSSHCLLITGDPGLRFVKMCFTCSTCLIFRFLKLLNHG